MELKTKKFRKFLKNLKLRDLGHKDQWFNDKGLP